MSQQSVLLIDDEQHIADVVVYILEEHGFRVISALEGQSGLRRFQQEHPDLVILDLNLPGIMGLELFDLMKKDRPDVPIIMLTSRSDEVDRVLGLEMGADDYVTKPFSPRELAARVKVVLRRARVTTAASKLLREGPFEVDPDAYSLSYFGQRTDLTRSEFELMKTLISYPARVFVRDELIRRIYDESHPVTDRTIDAYIKRVRKKFQTIRPGLNPIQTVYGIGYKLSQELNEEDA